MDANDLYDPEFRELIKSKNPTIIIPVGSLEQHGAHLPITTDSDIVTEIASRLGKKCNFIVFPTISYGVSHEHYPLFNTSVDLSRLLKSMLRSLSETEIKSVVILNGHHGNERSIPDNWYSIDAKLRVYSYWHFMKHEFDHAGFVETSLMLAISDKVKMEKAKKGLITKGLSEKEIQRIKELSTERSGFPKVTENGVWGDPTGATKNDGEKFLAEIVRNLAKECQS
jgi:creatinine amidohydrolase